MSEAENNLSQLGSGANAVDNPGASMATLTGASQGSLISRPVFMPEVFNATNREWSDWVEQFEQAANVNGWDDAVKLKFMSLLLSGRARALYNGIPVEAKTNYELLKISLTKCLEPCRSDEWNRVAFTQRRRLPNETAQEFGNALRRLAVQAYPSVDDGTCDMLARDQFITHFAVGDFRISLRAAKPKTLEAAMHLAAEMELLRNLEQTCVAPSAQVRGVAEDTCKTNQRLDALLGVVEGLRQEVKTIQSTVHSLQLAPRAAVHAGLTPGSQSSSSAPSGPSIPSMSGRRARNQTGVCWECGCDRHLRRDCPYVSGN